MVNVLPTRSAEVSAGIGAIGAILTAAVFSQVDALRFGSFFQMLGVLLAADAVFYIAKKLMWMRKRDTGNRT